MSLHSFCPMAANVEGPLGVMCNFCNRNNQFWRVLGRTIDKYGGLDAYLLETPDKKLVSDVGSKLKEQIRAALVMQKQQRQTNSTSQVSSSMPVSSMYLLSGQQDSSLVRA